VRQVRLLARTFFVRLFESDLMPPGLPQVQLVIWSVVLVATPALTLPGLFVQKYTRLWYEPGTLGPAIATDRLVLLTLAMIAAGLVAIVVWENALPDRRDARILGVLPVSTNAFVAGRLLALGQLFSLFFATLGLIPSVVFSCIAAAYDEPGSLLRLSAAQLTAALAATLTAFCGIIAVQCIVISSLGRRMAQRAAIAIQLLFAIALVQMIVFLPSLGRSMKDGNLAPDWLSSSNAAMLPSVWFLGLFEVLTGFGGRNAFPLAGWALTATAVSVASAVVLYAASYRRLATQALETAPPDTTWARWWRRRRLLPADHLVGARRAATATAAVRQFTMRTLSRSRQHRTLLALYLGLGLAVVVSSIVPLAVQRGMAAFTRPGIAILAAPLVLMFVALVGMRVAFAIPVTITANWVIRLREPGEIGAAMDGALTAMLIWAVAPFVLVSVISTGVLWGFGVASQHAVVTALLGWLLSEVLTFRLCKIPFTCTYMPGRSEVKTLWPFYFTAFTSFTYSMAELELQMLRRPVLIAAFIVIVSAVALIARVARRRWLAEQPGLRFAEEEHGALFEGFHLSEGLAATGREHQRTS
jgi:hypothetical protein